MFRALSSTRAYGLALSLFVDLGCGEDKITNLNYNENNPGGNNGGGTQNNGACAVGVNPQVMVLSGSTTMTVGGTAQLGLSCMPTGGGSWTSSSPSIAGVSSSGLVTGIAAGTTEVCFNYGSVQKACVTVTVTSVNTGSGIASISVNPASHTTTVNQVVLSTVTVNLTSGSNASLGFGLGNNSDNTCVSFALSGSGQSVTGTALRSGCTAVQTIFATADPSKTATMTVVVSAVSAGVTGISFPTFTGLQYGSNCTSAPFAINATTTPSGQSLSYQVTSGNATYNSATGLFTLTGTGPFTVKATAANGYTVSHTYQVAACAPNATGLTVSPFELNTRYFGNNCTSTGVQLTWQVLPAGSNQAVTFTSSNPTVGAVSSTGFISPPTGTGTGYVRVTLVAEPSIFRDVPISVASCNTQSNVVVTLSPGSTSRPAGSTLQLTATVTGGENRVVYESSHPSRVGVNQTTGLITFVAKSANGDGTARICAIWAPGGVPNRNYMACHDYTVQ